MVAAAGAEPVRLILPTASWVSLGPAVALLDEIWHGKGEVLAQKVVARIPDKDPPEDLKTEAPVGSLAFGTGTFRAAIHRLNCGVVGCSRRHETSGEPVSPVERFDRLEFLARVIVPMGEVRPDDGLEWDRIDLSRRKGPTRVALVR